MLKLTRLNAAADGFWDRLEEKLAWESVSDEHVASTVKEVIANIRRRGDEALLEYTERFDRLHLDSAAKLEIPQERLRQASENISSDEREALDFAVGRLKSYHQRQIQESWTYTQDDGTLLGQKVTPLDSVGLYVPGGKAAYPSSVLMNAVPAIVAGVKELVMVVPTPAGEVNEMVLAAAHVVGVSRVFTLGGAQAVAALAYGTETVPKVDKIVGPGNIYVATAKSQVYGAVGIDMIAGPSEILIICDGETNPDWIAMDLFSQAEHDEQAQAILIAMDDGFIDRVQESIERLLPQMERQEMIRTSLQDRGVLIKVSDLEHAAEVANYIAPEHLELSVADPQALTEKIRHAGAIFMGRYSAEAMGDYCAGPNHVLPTSRTARFSSPLGVYDFQKRSSLIFCSEEGADTLGRVSSVLARSEGLTAHARSAEFRIKHR